MQKSFIVASICTVLLVSLAGDAARAYDAETLKIAYSYERQGIMTHQQYLKLYDVCEETKPGGKVPDSDLAYALGLLKSNALNTKMTAFRHEEVASSITFGYNSYYYTGWSAHQKDKLLQAAVWLMHQSRVTSDQGWDNNRMAAIFLLRAVADERSLVYLRQLAHDPNPKTASLAGKAYARILELLSRTKAAHNTTSRRMHVSGDKK